MIYYHYYVGDGNVSNDRVEMEEKEKKKFPKKVTNVLFSHALYQYNIIFNVGSRTRRNWLGTL